MISVLKSIWQVSTPGYQMLWIVAINLIYLLFLFGWYVGGLIPMGVVQLGNAIFWMVLGTIVLFGPFWRRTK